MKRFVPDTSPVSRPDDPNEESRWSIIFKKAWDHLSHAFLQETQVLLISGLLVGIGAGVGLSSFVNSSVDVPFSFC